MNTMQDKIADLQRRRAAAELGGGADRLDKQRQAGKLTARERIAALVDPDSFDETGLFAGVSAFYDHADNDYWIDVPDAGPDSTPARVRPAADRRFRWEGMGVL